MTPKKASTTKRTAATKAPTTPSPSPATPQTTQAPSTQSKAVKTSAKTEPLPKSNPQPPSKVVARRPNPPQTPTATVPASPPTPTPAPLPTPAPSPTRESSTASTFPTPVPASKPVTVTFALPELGARQVSLSGDFNQWSPHGHPMHRFEGGRWETTIELAPGRYQYKFVVDGEWIPDPWAKENVWNELGTLNSVIEVHA